MYGLSHFEDRASESRLMNKDISLPIRQSTVVQTGVKEAWRLSHKGLYLRFFSFSAVSSTWSGEVRRYEGALESRTRASNSVMAWGCHAPLMSARR